MNLGLGTHTGRNNSPNNMQAPQMFKHAESQSQSCHRDSKLPQMENCNGKPLRKITSDGSQKTFTEQFNGTCGTKAKFVRESQTSQG